MKYYIVDAFTDKPFGGNPAGVVLLDSDAFPKEELMLNIAAELRFSETAFVRRDGESEFTLRYFTPKAEVDLCGHATIASFSLLHQRGMASGQCLCHTKAGDLHIEVSEKVMMQMAKPTALSFKAKPWDDLQWSPPAFKPTGISLSAALRACRLSDTLQTITRQKILSYHIVSDKEKKCSFAFGKKHIINRKTSKPHLVIK